VVTKANALGDYLRARRQQVRPEDVGLIPGARRRVSGLRREELAMLAGISAEYYLRLEVGRDTNPSQQVIDALARALQLNALETRHLQYLAAPTGSDLCDREAAAAYDYGEVIQQFLMPAALIDRHLNVMAANPTARALSPEFAPGQNFLRWRLLDPAAKSLYVDWDAATASAVAGLRDLGGRRPEDPEMQALITELTSASARFRELWPRADVGYHFGVHHYRHPVVGELLLSRSRLNAPYPGGEHVVMYRPEPGSDSARAVEELRSLPEAATASAEETR
jgi:transcriptional regulator with XRE-family HTH domain